MTAQQRDMAEAAATLLSLDKPPTAIMTSSDAAALGVVHAARERGLDVPHDLSVVGFDDIPEAKYLTPGLTTVRQPMGEMGRTAAHLILDTLVDDERRVPSVDIPTELIIRGSTGPPRR